MCLSPLRLPDREWSRAIVRCGQCTPCLIRRKQQWVGRLRFENQSHVSSRFLTLTYRDAPDTLDVTDLQLFAKRYRYHYGKTRFFAVGEYGGRSGRPHWHVISFGIAPEVDAFKRDKRMPPDEFH